MAAHLLCEIAMCPIQPHAFYAVVRVRTTSISYIWVHLDPICPTWPSYYNGGSFTMRNRHVSNTAPCLLCSCACLHDLHVIHMSTSRHHLSNMALLLQWRLIWLCEIAMCPIQPHAFYAVARVRTTFISYIWVHLDPICPTWPSYYNGGSFTMRNRHVSNTAPCLLCSCACPHDLHIIHMSTSRHHLSNMALLLQWRLIWLCEIAMCPIQPHAFYAVARVCTTSISYIWVHLDTICPTWPSYYNVGSFTMRNRHVSNSVQYSPMPFMQLCVSARPSCHTYEYI